jgi:uncharacterized protein (DUF1330 family)
MSFYLIAQINIRDRMKYRQYKEGFNAIFSQYNGEFIVVDDNPEVLEGEFSLVRHAIIRFPSNEDLKRWYFSEQYQELSKLRKESSDGNVMIVKGIEEFINSKKSDNNIRTS